jgi:cytochrome b subunit of formate dehydrogenase
MENTKQENHSGRKKTLLWIFLIIGFILIGSGLIVPQRTGLIDISKIELLTGIMLAASAIVSALVA